jgi:hypothetical protein
MAQLWKRSITIDHTKVGSATHTNFPVGIIGTYADLKDGANGGHAASGNNGKDIRFYTASDLLTPLDQEKVKYVAATGEIEFYVRIPSLSNSVDTEIWMAYGDTALTSDVSTTAVWNSGFRAVYHLGDATTLSVNDSTSNGITLTNTASVAAAVGPNSLGGCASFNGTSNYLVKTGGAIEVGEPITVSFLANPDAVAAQRTMVMEAIQASPTTNCPIVFKMNTAKVRQTYNSGNNETPGTLSAGTWAYIMSRWVSSSSAIIHLNNDGGTGVTPAGALNGSIDTTAIGALVANGTVQGFFDGDIDEVRFSNVDRGADWALAEWNNLLTPSTFYAVGTETSVGGAATSRPIFSASKPRFTTPRRRML